MKHHKLADGCSTSNTWRSHESQKMKSATLICCKSFFRVFTENQANGSCRGKLWNLIHLKKPFQISSTVTNMTKRKAHFLIWCVYHSNPAGNLQEAIRHHRNLFFSLSLRSLIKIRQKAKYISHISLFVAYI